MRPWASWTFLRKIGGGWLANGVPRSYMLTGHSRNPSGWALSVMASVRLRGLRAAAPGEGSGIVAPGDSPVLTVCDRWDDGVATVTVRGEIDLGTVGALSERLGDVARQNPRQLVINLAEVRFLDSTGLHAFVRVRRELPEPCPVILRSPQPQIRRVFNITGLSPLFVFE